MSSGVKKTNAMRMLDSAKIPYERAAIRPGLSCFASP